MNTRSIYTQYKLFKIIFIICVTLETVKGLRCWECKNASSNAECLTEGRVKLCRLNEGSCQNTIRVSDGGAKIFKTCKQTRACMNNVKQNGPIAMAWHPIQCSVRSPNTVCRCCCTTNKCNDHALFCRGEAHQAQLRRQIQSKRMRSSQRSPPKKPDVDINECEGINNGMGNCQHAYACRNTIGSFICDCHEGYMGLLCEETIEEHNRPGHVHKDPL